MQLWTDGSFQQIGERTKCGVGILIRRLALDCETLKRKVQEHKFSVSLQQVDDNNLAELYAIQYGLFKISQLRLHEKEQNLSIITDSQTAINLINGTQPPKKQAYKEAVDDIRWRLRKYNYKLYWKKGHADCDRQILCDRLAKKARNR